MKKIVATLLTICFFVSCAGMGVSPTDLQTPHARGRFVLMTYVRAFQDHQRFAALPNLTDDAKKLLNAKRDILIAMNQPAIGPIPVFVNYIETGQVITDLVFDAILDQLLLLETGWYTDSKMDKTFMLRPSAKNTEKELDDAITKAAVEASLVKADKFDPIVVGSLIELIRLGIHALRTLLEQRNLDELQMAEAYNVALEQYRSLDMNALVVLE